MRARRTVGVVQILSQLLPELTKKKDVIRSFPPATQTARKASTSWRQNHDCTTAHNTGLKGRPMLTQPQRDTRSE